MIQCSYICTKFRANLFKVMCQDLSATKIEKDSHPFKGPAGAEEFHDRTRYTSKMQTETDAQSKGKEIFD